MSSNTIMNDNVHDHGWKLLIKWVKCLYNSNHLGKLMDHSDMLAGSNVLCFWFINNTFRATWC